MKFKQFEQIAIRGKSRDTILLYGGPADGPHHYYLNAQGARVGTIYGDEMLPWALAYPPTTSKVPLDIIEDRMNKSDPTIVKRDEMLRSVFTTPPMAEAPKMILSKPNTLISSPRERVAGLGTAGQDLIIQVWQKSCAFLVENNTPLNQHRWHDGPFRKACESSSGWNCYPGDWYAAGTPNDFSVNSEKEAREWVATGVRSTSKENQ